MADEYLFCNYNHCKVPITKLTWVTRCSHIFCEEHGDSFFINSSSKIKCPVCNELIIRETDAIKTNLNPPDMLLCCVRPEKALDYVKNATKLWSYQMRQKHKINMELLSEKYEEIASHAMSKLKAENKEMKKLIKDIESQLNSVNKKLAYTKRKLWKYKLAYNNQCARNQHSPMDSDRNNPFFQNISAEMCSEFEDILQYGDLSNFDNIMSPHFD